MGDLLIASDESVRHFPNLQLAQKLYEYELCIKGLGAGASEAPALLSEILEQVFLDEMAPFYFVCCDKYGWTLDEHKAEAMAAANLKGLEDIEVKMQEAVTNAGDTEVLEVMFAKAQHFCKIGAWREASAAYDAVLAKDKAGTGKKIDATMAQIRIALFELVGF